MSVPPPGTDIDRPLRHSLKDINKDNVKNLKVAWTMHLGGVEGGGIWTHGSLEGTSIVENGFMYVTDGWGSVFKIDTHGAKTLTTWSGWRDCAADASGFHAIKFGYDPATSPDGTIVAGHPAVLTLLVDNAGTVSGLLIETDPKARLYIRKKAFLFGIQVKSRYGLDGWSCTQAQPNAGEQPVGGVYVSERCTKNTRNRSIVVERNLFRKPDQDMKNFVDETRMTILRARE